MFNVWKNLIFFEWASEKNAREGKGGREYFHMSERGRDLEKFKNHWTKQS